MVKLCSLMNEATSTILITELKTTPWQRFEPSPLDGNMQCLIYLLEGAFSVNGTIASTIYRKPTRKRWLTTKVLSCVRSFPIFLTSAHQCIRRSNRIDEITRRKERSPCHAMLHDVWIENYSALVATDFWVNFTVPNRQVNIQIFPPWFSVRPGVCCRNMMNKLVPWLYITCLMESEKEHTYKKHLHWTLFHS